MTKSDPYPIGSGNGKAARIILVSFDGDSVSSDGAEEEIRKENMRPARDEELDEFNEAHPTVQDDHLIVFLGTVETQHGFRYVPCLTATRPRQKYGEYRKRPWPAGTRFAAVPLN